MSSSERIDALVAGAPPEADEQRLARLIYELQAVRPSAPEALRGRVDALAASEGARRPSLLERLSLRRAVLVLAPAVLVASLGSAAVLGIVSATTGNEKGAVPARELRERLDVREAAPGALTARGATVLPEVTKEALAPDQAPRSAAVPTTPGRAQDYHAALRLRVDDVDDLSAQTQQALRLTRRYGGYVVSVDYGNPGAERGDAVLELRVPVGRVQEAIVDFSQLGSIVSQNVTIRDLQGQIDIYTRDIRRLRDRMAALRASLLDPKLTDVERARIERELTEARSRIAALEQERRLLNRQGRFAKISLALTTQGVAAKKDEAGRIERAFDDAGAVLAKEVAFALYALVVAAPFLLLAALGVAGARAGRRRADQRLLERA